MSNKRNSPRFPVQLEIHFSAVEDGGGDRIGTLLTASPFGVFLKTDEVFENETMVELILPLQEYPLHVLGRVAWISNNPPIGIGIEFQGVTKESQNDILTTIHAGAWLQGDFGDEPDIFSSDTDEIIADLE